MYPAESRVFKTVCLDKKCQTVLLVYPGERCIECHQCGQKHDKSSFQDLREVPPDEIKEALQSYLYKLIINANVPKRGTEMIKVLGLSNYHCKLLSPLLTQYGMEKNTGRAKLLTEMNQGEILDCSVFGDRAFLIEPEHISIHGFGKDITGSLDYLSETLKLIVAYNGDEERLIPIHADGDGHCLVHAISRALVGRELFWHPLRCCLKKHFIVNLDKYKELFKDFIDTDEWPSIIEECDPGFQPPDGELHGLRNIHIFGLANVLRRPIILLDSLECMQKCGDYSALFLPGFVSPDMCKGKDSTALNKPLCIAWSSYSHNHYIPLVGIQRKPLPSLPAALIPKVWGMPQSQISSYMEFDTEGGCIIGGNKTLTEAYIQRLVYAMESLYYEKNGIHPSLVADAKFYLYPDNVLFSAKPAMVLEMAKAAVQEGRLYRCLRCRALCELSHAEAKWTPNNSAVGSLQNLKKNQDSNLSYSDIYNYASMNDNSVNDIRPELQHCIFCRSPLIRKVTNDGTVMYKAEDKDNLDRYFCMHEQARRYFPEESVSQEFNKEVKPTARIPLKLVWDGQIIEDDISYTDLRNSEANQCLFVKELSKKLMLKHFSDKSTNIELQTYIIDEIWKIIQKYNAKNSSDLPSKPEFNREESSKTMKLETPIACRPKPSEFKYIKVCTSNGLQANYALSDEGTTYGQLQEWIKNEFKIPVKNQVIKKGVPPRLIKPSGDTSKQMLSDLKHGDRIMVEIQRRDDNPYSLNICTPQRNVLKDSNIPKADIKYPSDPSWDSIKATTAHFRRGGFIYKLVASKSNYKLKRSPHVTLPEYPDKVFCYNTMTDFIDLCVKPLGHFLISSDIEERIDEVKCGLYVVGHWECPLTNKVQEENEAFVRSMFLGYESEQLVRKAPGCSTVCQNPDDMDIS